MKPCCEFTIAHYGEILTEAKRSFEILSFREAARLGRKPKQILLRHDIDFSIHDALLMADLEAKLGICSTYCVLLHSPTYHIGEIETLKTLREIAGLGHEIGLHYDLSFFENAGIAPSEGIAREAEHLGLLAGVRVGTVSQHKPATHGQFGGVGGRFVDAYSAPFTEEIGYVSDSRRTWRAECLHKLLPHVERLQVLIHPEWWEADYMKTRRETIERLVQMRSHEIAEAMEKYAASMEMKQSPESG